jgi:hypothetical protein
MAILWQATYAGQLLPTWTHYREELLDQVSDAHTNVQEKSNVFREKFIFPLAEGWGPSSFVVRQFTEKSLVAIFQGIPSLLRRAPWLYSGGFPDSVHSLSSRLLLLL